ncbi:hypothetical protein POVCU2_0017480 [Plasmodium ovale curtisi]|uniref:Uncharacterized protein n=1 Tax=Plasmodium ovale curtisi TaxID=864141 RepID=A0A1A8VT44_PLAOA|nr:hypothetical protein POVCU2_0017480 [Plasmodium ovale curtisi]
MEKKGKTYQRTDGRTDEQMSGRTEKCTQVIDERSDLVIICCANVSEVGKIITIFFVLSYVDKRLIRDFHTNWALYRGERGGGDKQNEWGREKKGKFINYKRADLNNCSPFR